LPVDQEIIKHPVEAGKVEVLQPGQHVNPQRKVAPLPECAWFFYSEFAELWPDRNSRIRSEDVWGEAHIGIAAANLARGSEGNLTIGLGFAWVAKDEIECDLDSTDSSPARCLIDLIDTLMPLIHQFQNGLRG